MRARARVYMYVCVHAHVYVCVCIFSLLLFSVVCNVILSVLYCPVFISILPMILQTFLKGQKMALSCGGFRGQKKRGQIWQFGDYWKMCYIVNILNLCLSRISQSFNRARNDQVQPAWPPAGPPKVIRSFRRWQQSEVTSCQKKEMTTSFTCHHQHTQCITPVWCHLCDSRKSW